MVVVVVVSCRRGDGGGGGGGSEESVAYIHFVCATLVGKLNITHHHHIYNCLQQNLTAIFIFLAPSIH
jgi:hypothetical protein